MISSSHKHFFSANTRGSLGRNLLSSARVSLCLERLASSCLSSPTSISSCQYFLPLGSPSAVSTRQTTPWSSIWWDQKSRRAHNFHLRVTLHLRSPPYIQSLHAFNSAGIVFGEKNNRSNNFSNLPLSIVVGSPLLPKWEGFLWCDRGNQLYCSSSKSFGIFKSYRSGRIRASCCSIRWSPKSSLAVHHLFCYSSSACSWVPSHG